MITPEEAFSKYWEQRGVDFHGISIAKDAFLAGIQCKELHQIGVLADIRKAVGDGEGRLMQEELVKRIEGLVSPWKPIDSALDEEGKYFFCLLAWGPEEDPCTAFGFRWNGKWFAAPAFYNGRPHDECQMQLRQKEVFPTHFMEMPKTPKSVMTEKEEA